MKKTYAGRLEEREYGDNVTALFVGESQYPLAEAVQDDIEIFGNFLSVRYFISDEPLSIEELEGRLIKRLYGEGEAEYEDVYTEWTGYLWTNESIHVGGHNLLREINSHLGRYLWMEIDYNQNGVDHAM